MIKANDLQYGDILAFEPRSWQGNLITYYDKSKYSHCAIYLGKLHNRHLFIEADWSGVRINAINIDWKNVYMYRTHYKPRSIKSVLKQVGKKYDYYKLWRIFLHYAFKRPMKTKGDAEDNFICTEFVNYVFMYRIAERGYATPRTITESTKVTAYGVLVDK